MTQNNLAIAYSDRIEGERRENLEQAIACYLDSLKVRTFEAFPEKWAMTQNNLAIAYSDRIEGERRENLEQAIKLYRNALTIRLPQALPLDCLQTARNLGNLGFKEGDWNLAIEGYSLAIEAVELSRSWILDDTRRQEIIAESIEVYENIVQSYINLAQKESPLNKGGYYAKAIEYSERSRSKRLVDLMHSNDLYGNAEIPEEVKEYLDAYQTIEEEISKFRNFNPPDESKTLTSLSTRKAPTLAEIKEIQSNLQALEQKKQEVYQKLRRLDPVIAGQIQVAGINIKEIYQLIDSPNTAIIQFYSTAKDTHVFILKSKEENSLDLFTLTGKGKENLQNWLLENWSTPYQKNNQQWFNNLENFLQELSEKLELNHLIKTYLQGIEELIIVPHLALHQIPFSALPVDFALTPNSFPQEGGEQILTKDHRGFVNSNNEVKLEQTLTKETPEIKEIKPPRKTLNDLFRLRIIPSCQILNYCYQRETITEEKIGIVEDATKDLIYTSYECENIAEKFNILKEFRLKQDQATVNNYYKLAKKLNILHSSHHASSNLIDPLKSELILSDRSLTLGELLTLNWRMPNLKNVYLNDCETNLTKIELTDDILTISTGFLCAGARNVISTLWSVDDFASALLALFYYENIENKLTSTEALRQSQIKLKNLTKAEFCAKYKAKLENYLEQKLKEIAEEIKAYSPDSQEYQKCNNLLVKLTYQKEITLFNYSQKEYPFASAYFWSAFISQGLS